MTRLNLADLLKGGFTLIEVMTAMTIISITLTTALVALSGIVDNTAYTRDKTLALWVAKNRLTERAAGILQTQGEERQGNALYVWKTHEEMTDDGRARRLDVNVYLQDDMYDPVITISGFFPVKK